MVVLRVSSVLALCMHCCDLHFVTYVCGFFLFLFGFFCCCFFFKC